MDKKLDINAQTKIGEMLDVYPQLEEVLLRLSPSFAKLKNPVLRRTVGRVASLRQAAQIGGIAIGTLVLTLRQAAGLNADISVEAVDDTENSPRPDWVIEDHISIRFDASPIIEEGGNPMTKILENAEKIEQGKLFLLIAPFKPVPIIELLISKGFISWSESVEDKIYSYFTKR